MSMTNIKELALYQQRVVDEKNQLQEKMSKLDNFFSTNTFVQLDPGEQSRLQRQWLIMQLYEQVLSERISNFK
jgi:hypothetical protein